MAFKETIHIGAPVETVFTVATDPAYAAKIMDNVVKAEKITEGPMQAGTQIKELRNVRARAVETILHVTGFIANEKYVVKSESAGMTIEYQYLFLTEKDGTTVHFKGIIRSKGLKNMLIKPFFEKILKKEDENHLQRLKEYIEEKGSDSNDQQ